jgi:hypothetical protein
MAPHVRCKETVGPVGEVIVPSRAYYKVDVIRHQAGCEDRQVYVLLRLDD